MSATGEPEVSTKKDDNLTKQNTEETEAGALETVKNITPAEENLTLDSATEYLSGRASKFESMYIEKATSGKLMSGRLVDFKYSDGSKDDQHRAYLKLAATSDQNELERLYKSLGSDTMYGTDIKELFCSLVTGYNSVIITQISEALAEKSAPMQTVGDSYALTLGGAEYQLFTIQGYLPFDYSGREDGSYDYNWYTGMINAYRYILRGSILARYHCELRIIFPDFCIYKAYPVTFNCNMDAGSDMMIPFSMGSYIKQYVPICSDAYSFVGEGRVKNPSDVGNIASGNAWSKSIAAAVDGVKNDNIIVRTATAITSKGVGAIDWDNLGSLGKR